MATVISFANMKGGVGKTTLCVNLAYEFFRQGNRVLVVDNDPQFNATMTLMTPRAYINACIEPGTHATVYDVYEKPPRVRGAKPKRPDPSRFLIKTWHFIDDPGIALHLMASRIELYETLRNPSQKEYLLDKFLTRHAQAFDFVFIDCPPTPSVLTLSAFAASDYVLIPVTPDYYATIGLPQFLGTLADFKSDLHDAHDVTALGVVFTNVERRISENTRKSMQRVRQALSGLSPDIPVFDSKLSHLKVFEKTLWQSVPVHKISGRGTRGKSLAAIELRAIAAEVEQKIAQHKGQTR